MNYSTRHTSSVAPFSYSANNAHAFYREMAEILRGLALADASIREMSGDKDFIECQLAILAVLEAGAHRMRRLIPRDWPG